MDDLEDVLATLRRALKQMRSTAEARGADMASGSVEHRMFDQLLAEFSVALNAIDVAGAATGIGQFIRDFYGNQNIDLAAHQTAIIGSIETAAATIRSGAPLGTGDYVLAYQYDSDPRAVEPRVWRTYSSAQTATLQTQLAAISTAITAFFAAVIA